MMNTWNAIIGSNGLDMVVWGIGSTLDEATTDAATALDDGTETEVVTVTCEVPLAVVERVQSGVIDCALLGITVTLDRDGDPTEAEYTASSSDELLS